MTGAGSDAVAVATVVVAAVGFISVVVGIIVRAVVCAMCCADGEEDSADVGEANDDDSSAPFGPNATFAFGGARGGVTACADGAWTCVSAIVPPTNAFPPASPPRI